MSENITARVTEDEHDVKEYREVKRRADLHQAVWEASQSMGADEIREYVESTLREVDGDAL